MGSGFGSSDSPNWADLLSGLSGDKPSAGNTIPVSDASNYLAGMLAIPSQPAPKPPTGSPLTPLHIFSGLLSPTLPGTPSQFNRDYIEKVIARGDRRVENLSDRLDGITEGRVMPDKDDITIGSARRFDLAVLFLDICGFSGRPNWWAEEQKKVLTVMNMFMAEMLSIVHDYGGTYEKNTGDGLMAYFGEGEKTASAVVKPAVEAALIMHYVNDYLLTPWFQKHDIPPVSFRVGIDYGPVMIARVGIHGEKNSRVAVGTVANIACKLMNRISNGGICIGNEVYKVLPHNWASTCQASKENSGFTYVSDQSNYTAWELNHRLSPPSY
jgi:adenylate cyclase